MGPDKLIPFEKNPSVHPPEVERSTCPVFSQRIEVRKNSKTLGREGGFFSPGCKWRYVISPINGQKKMGETLVLFHPIPINGVES